MSRYIDADALIDNFAELTVDLWLDSVEEAEIVSLIGNSPSIDIVFCKECKYEPICSHSVQHTTHEPTSVTIGYKSVDFCSYGEREGE